MEKNKTWWDKYVFDPRRPKDFKAYGLLKKLLQEKQTLLVIDNYNLPVFFEKEIWTPDVEASLWDKPDNFSELSPIEKFNVYAENFSEKEFDELAEKKEAAFLASPYLGMFAGLGEIKITNTHFYEFLSYITSSGSILGAADHNNIKMYEIVTNINEDMRDEYMYENDPNYISPNACVVDMGLEVTSNHPCCIFFPHKVLKEDGSFPFQEHEVFKPNKASVFFVLEEDFKKYELGDNFKFQTLHPIILKKLSDVHLLFDYLRRDVAGVKAAAETFERKEAIYIDKVELKDYFSIKEVALDGMRDKKEIYLTGENGDGKTIVLQAIALALRGNQNIGEVTNVIKYNNWENASLVATTSDGESYAFAQNPKEQGAVYDGLFGYGINRFRNDSDKKDAYGFLSLFDKETHLENPVKWLQHLDYKEARNDTSEISLTQAKRILTDIMERDLDIQVSPNGVTFSEKGSPLQFNQLSDGYQSVLVWVCDLMARLSTLHPHTADTSEFVGTVLVDEIGAYLHPKWAHEVVRKLRSWLPKVQFIFTTHNPVVVLGASADAVFYKVYKKDGETCVSEPIQDISDLMLNSIATSPLFGIETAVSHSAKNLENVSSDDYIYHRIHQKIRERLAKEPNLIDEDVLRMIEEELDNLNQ